MKIYLFESTLIVSYLDILVVEAVEFTILNSLQITFALLNKTMNKEIFFSIFK